MTTKEAIKLLPIEDSLKMEIINMYDYLEPGFKLTVERIAWNYYHTLRATKLDGELDQQMDKVHKGEEHFGKDYYAKAVKKADHDMEMEIDKSAEGSNLAAARRAMEKIVREIQDAKLAKKEAAAKKLKPQ